MVAGTLGIDDLREEKALEGTAVRHGGYSAEIRSEGGNRAATGYSHLDGRRRQEDNDN